MDYINIPKENDKNWKETRGWKRFEIVSNMDKEEFENKVNYYIENGYKPLGGLVSDKKYYKIAMYRATMVICPLCNGTRVISAKNEERNQVLVCPECKGKGKIDDTELL